MAPLMPTLLDFDDMHFPLPLMSTEPSPRCATSSATLFPMPIVPSQTAQHWQQPAHEQPLDITAHIPFSTPLDQSSARFGSPEFANRGFSRYAPVPPSVEHSTIVDQPVTTTVGFGNYTQHCIAKHYAAQAAHRRSQSALPVFDTLFTDAGGSSLGRSGAGVVGSSHVLPDTSSGSASSAVASGSVGPSTSGGRKAVRGGVLSKDKIAERRRKNRESSSRCYYNRKKQIGEIEVNYQECRRRAIALHARELELRNENARLKMELVLRNIRIPPAMLTTTPTDCPTVLDLKPC